MLSSEQEGEGIAEQKAPQRMVLDEASTEMSEISAPA